jgi:hypothetical protein
MEGDDDDDVVAADGDTVSALCLRPGSLVGCVMVLIYLYSFIFL